MASHRRRKTPRPPRRRTRVGRTQLALLWVSIALLVVAIVTLLVMVLAWRFPVPQQVIVRVETSASSPCDGRTLRPRDAVSKPRQVDSAPLGASQRQVLVHVMTARRSDFTSRPVATAPRIHLDSPWEEWGSSFVFPSAGCWDMHAAGDTASGDVWLVVQ